MGPTGMTPIVLALTSLAELATGDGRAKFVGNTLTPEKILRSGNRTIVFWEDGTKTVVKRAEDEAHSDYAAVTAALAIKVFGSNSAVKRVVAMAKDQEPKAKRKKGAEDE